MKVELAKYYASNIFFEIRSESEQSIRLETKITHRFKQDTESNENAYKVTDDIEIADADSIMQIRLTVKSRFICDFEGEDRHSLDEQLRHDTFSGIFPFIRAMVSSITTTAGLPPYLLPFVELPADNVVGEDFDE